MANASLPQAVMTPYACGDAEAGAELTRSTPTPQGAGLFEQGALTRVQGDAWHHFRVLAESQDADGKPITCMVPVDLLPGVEVDTPDEGLIW